MVSPAPSMAQTPTCLHPLPTPTFTSSSYRGILCTGLIIRSDRACFSLFSRMLCCKTPVGDKDGPVRWDTAGTRCATGPGTGATHVWVRKTAFYTIQSDSSSSQPSQ